MSDMIKPAKIGKKSVVMNGETMYMRLLSVNANKKVPVKHVFSFENAAVPLSLFTEDGEMITTVKSQFMHKLESLTKVRISIMQDF